MNCLNPLIWWSRESSRNGCNRKLMCRYIIIKNLNWTVHPVGQLSSLFGRSNRARYLWVRVFVLPLVTCSLPPNCCILQSQLRGVILKSKKKCSLKFIKFSFHMNMNFSLALPTFLLQTSSNPKTSNFFSPLKLTNLVQPELKLQSFRLQQISPLIIIEMIFLPQTLNIKSFFLLFLLYCLRHLFSHHYCKWVAVSGSTFFGRVASGRISWSNFLDRIDWGRMCSTILRSNF